MGGGGSTVWWEPPPSLEGGCEAAMPNWSCSPSLLTLTHAALPPWGPLPPLISGGLRPAPGSWAFFSLVREAGKAKLPPCETC